MSLGGGAEGFHASLVASGTAGAVAAFVGRLVASADGRAFSAAFSLCKVAICEPDGEVRTMASSASNSAMRRCAASRSDLLANGLWRGGLLLEVILFWFCGYLLFVICYLLFVICYLLFVICYLLGLQVSRG